jgi:hypothetical protein
VTILFLALKQVSLSARSSDILLFCTPNEVIFISSTGIVGYSIIESIDQMKNALYFRGDVGVSIDAGGLPGQSEFSDLSSYSDNFTWPSDDQDLHEQAHLGRGVSVPFPGSTDHVVAVVGWGPCTVIPCNSDSDGEIEAECWIGMYFFSLVSLYL